MPVTVWSRFVARLIHGACRTAAETIPDSPHPNITSWLLLLKSYEVINDKQPPIQNAPAAGCHDRRISGDPGCLSANQGGRHVHGPAVPEPRDRLGHRGGFHSPSDR